MQGLQGQHVNRPVSPSCGCSLQRCLLHPSVAEAVPAEQGAEVAVLERAAAYYWARNTASGSTPVMRRRSSHLLAAVPAAAAAAAAQAVQAATTAVVAVSATPGA